MRRGAYRILQKDIRFSTGYLGLRIANSIIRFWSFVIGLLRYRSSKDMLPALPSLLYLVPTSIAGLSVLYRLLLGVRALCRRSRAGSR